MLEGSELRIVVIVVIANHASRTRSEEVAESIALVCTFEAAGANAERLIVAPVST